MSIAESKEREALSKEDKNNNSNKNELSSSADSQAAAAAGGAAVDQQVDDCFYRARTPKTVVLLLSLIIAGVAFSLLGSSFVDLQDLFDCDARALSMVMPISSLGLIGASCVAIFRLNKFSVELSMIMSLIVLGLNTSIWTAVTSVYWFLALSIVHGYFSCLLFCEMQPYFLQLWANHKLQKPLLLAIHGLMTLGLALGPFLVAPFLANSSASHGHGHSPVSAPVEEVPLDHNELYNTTGYTSTGPDILNASSSGHPRKYTGNVQKAFVVLGLPILAPAIVYAIICFKNGSLLWRKTSQAVKHESATTKRPVMSKLTRNILVGLTLAFFTCNAIAEFLPLSFFTLYVNALLGWVPPSSILINSAFNGALCLGRLLGIPLSVYLKPRTLLAMNLGTVLCAASLLLMSRLHDVIVWIGAALLGLGISTVFGTMTLWLSENMKVTDRLMAALIIANAVGAIVGPSITGQLFVIVSPMCMPLIVFFASIMTSTIYVILRVLERRRAKYSPVKQEENGFKK